VEETDAINCTDLIVRNHEIDLNQLNLCNEQKIILYGVIDISEKLYKTLRENFDIVHGYSTDTGRGKRPPNVTDKEWFKYRDQSDNGEHYRSGKGHVFILERIKKTLLDDFQNIIFQIWPTQNELTFPTEQQLDDIYRTTIR
jgi:hypothetical protein